MIKFIRLDERLIHGQIAIKWSRHTGVDRIVVINDEAAGNEMIKKSLMMAAPSTCKVAIKDVKAGVKILNDPRCSNLKILVIVSLINDLKTVLDSVHDIPYVNVGNYGRLAPKKEEKQRSRYGAHLYLYDEEVVELKAIIDSGMECNYQTTPEDISEKLNHVLKINYRKGEKLK